MKKITINFFINNWTPIACFIFTLLWFGAFSLVGVDPHHDGIMLKPAIDVANGKTIFKDTFTQYGMLTTYFQALAIKLLGPYLYSIRFCTVLFYAFSSVLLFFIWDNFLTKKYNFLLFVIFVIIAPFYPRPMLPWSSVYALFFMLLTNILLIEYIKKNSCFYIFLAGITSALAFWCRQPVGFVMYMAIITYLIIYFIYHPQKWKKILLDFISATSGYLMCIGLFLIYLWIIGGLYDFYIQSIKFAYFFGKQELNLIYMLKCLCPISDSSIFPFFTILVFIITFFSCLVNKTKYLKEKKLQLIATGIIGIASWHQFYPVYDHWHLFWATIPMIGFYVYFIQEITIFLRQKIKLFNKRILVFSLTLLLLIPISRKTFFFIKDSIERIEYIHNCKYLNKTVLKHIYLNSGEYQYFTNLINNIENVPQEYKNKIWINLTVDALYSLFPQNCINILSMPVNWENDVYLNYSETTENIIQKNKPIIMISTKLNDPDYFLYKKFISQDVWGYAREILIYLPKLK